MLENALPIQMENLKSDERENNKEIKFLESDIFKLCDAVMGQMFEGSKINIKKCLQGRGQSTST